MLNLGLSPELFGYLFFPAFLLKSCFFFFIAFSLSFAFCFEKQKLFRIKRKFSARHVDLQQLNVPLVQILFLGGT